MLHITLNNLENLILYNLPLKKKLPELSSLFASWLIGTRNTALKSMAQKALFDILHKLENYLPILEEHFQSKISIEKIDNLIVKDCKTNIFEAENTLNTMKFEELFLYREGEQLYIGSWR